MPLPNEDAPQHAPEPTAPPAGEAPTPDPTALTKQLEEERRARIRVQKEAERALVALKEREDADKSETEKAAARITELEQSLAARENAVRQAEVRAAAIDAASRLGFRNPEDGLRFLDMDILEFDDAGRPIGVDKQLAAILKERDYLKDKPRTPDAGQGDRGRTATLTVDEIRKMKPEEINARWDEVSQTLGSAGR